MEGHNCLLTEWRPGAEGPSMEGPPEKYTTPLEVVFFVDIHLVN